MQSSALINRISREVYETCGLTADVLARVEIDLGLVEEILTCLQSDNQADRAVALRFTNASLLEMTSPNLPDQSSDLWLPW